MISPDSPLVLGSASPRRRELLASLRLPLVVVPAPVDERRLAAESSGDYLDRVVAMKLGAARLAATSIGGAGVLVADTVVLLGDDVLGKPETSGAAEAMLVRLSGREHEVRTRFAIAARREAAEHSETVCTKVRFRALTHAEISRYAATGEGLDKAGGYAIQGVGSFAIAAISGSYTNVVGLPLCEVVLALQHLGLLGAFP